MATEALNDKAWRRKTLKKLQKGQSRLEEVLTARECHLVGSTALFVLVEHLRADELWHHLAENQILTRSFPGKPDWLRVGLPPSRAGFTKLDKALASF